MSPVDRSIWSSVGVVSLMLIVPVAAVLTNGPNPRRSVNLTRSMFHIVSMPSVAVPRLWFTVIDPLGFSVMS